LSSYVFTNPFEAVSLTRSPTLAKRIARCQTAWPDLQLNDSSERMPQNFRWISVQFATRTGHSQAHIRLPRNAGTTRADHTWSPRLMTSS